MTADLASGLLGYLAGELGAPALGFAQPLTPISGGFDTRIFAFRLADAPPAWAGPLILRLLSPRDDPRRALRERAVQNTVAELGYPAPRVLSASTDVTALGAAFLVMERRPGRPLLEARLIGAGGALGDMQARLHELDAEPLLRAMDRERPALGREVLGFDAHLAQLGARVSTGGLDGLASALDWLVAHRPTAHVRPAICHGDFHPQNLLHDGRGVTAVIDWPNALVADPVLDVASTLVILGQAPVELATRGVGRWVARIGRRLLIRRYLGAYRRRRPIDAVTVPYYEAAACMRGLVRAAAERKRAGAAGAANALDASGYPERLAARFAAITGVAPGLPPPAR